MFTNDNTIGDLDPIAEGQYTRARENAMRTAAMVECRDQALIAEMERGEKTEYRTGIETSCNDRQDNDCDGLADCGFKGPDFTYEADPDCACP